MSAARIQPPPRPWIVWALSATIALLSLTNLALACDQLAHADRYRALGVSYPPVLRAAFALAWALALGALALGLARRRGWARRWILVVLSNYGAFGVLWLMIYARSDFGRARIAFQAVVTALLVALVAWIMRWRRVRRAFAPPAGPVALPAEPHERNSGEVST